MKLIAFTVASGETVYINADAVLNVHECFKTEGWAAGTKTAIVYGNGLKVGVTEELQVVLDRLL